jgi:hypothetical protein
MKQLTNFFTNLGIRLFLARLSTFYPSYKNFKIH